MSRFITFLFLFVMCATMSFAQKISGTVTDDADGSPLPGVNIIIKGSSTGTISDFDGNFKLENVAEDATLVFSFVGYTTQEVSVTGKTSLSVSLKVDAMGLDEVVVVGYGVKKKSLVTGAISSVKADDIKTTSTSRVDHAMQGKTAGVLVMPTSGAPGSSSKIRIRGVSSNGNSNPLYIVDGMKTEDINNIAPGDIAGIEILKDAASAAIYGTEGANGVVLITTKSGKAGKSQITYDFQYGIQSFRNKKVKMMNAEQYKTWQEEAGVSLKTDINDYDTDWLDETFENAPMSKHRVGISGGTDKMTYMVSGSYMTRDGIVGGSKANYKRYTTRVNLKSTVKDWLEIGTNIGYNHQIKNNIAEDSEYSGLINHALLMDPLTPVTYDGIPSNIQDLLDQGKPILSKGDKYYGISQNLEGEFVNTQAEMETFHDKTTQDKLMGSAYAKISPFKGFSFTSRVGLELTNQNNHVWNGQFYMNNRAQNSVSSMTNTLDKWHRWVWENFATYTKTINAHTITALIGYSSEKYEHPNYSLRSGPMITDGWNFAYHTSAFSRNNDIVGSTMEEKTMASAFGRLSYDFGGKYMLEASLRRDGASEFPSSKKYGVFPALSVGWVISEEDFFSVPGLNYMKVRASWGSNGSKAGLRGNEDREYWTFVITELSRRYPDANGDYRTGAKIRSLPNGELLWETTTMTDIGVDFRFLNSKLTLTLDYYDKVTKDLLAIGSGPLSAGNKYPFVNAGDVSNKGFDIELGYRNMDGKFKYGATVNMSFVKNEVTSLSVNTPVVGARVREQNLSWFEEGLPIWYFKGYKTNGIHQADTEYGGLSWKAGDPIIVDTNNDGKILPNDKTNIGDPHPDMMFGGNLFAEYEGFDFTLSFQGMKGNDVFMGWFRPDYAHTNKPEFLFEDRWTPGNGGSRPRADNSSEYIYYSDLMVEDASYLRIKQIQLGYTLPREMTKTYGIETLRAYISLDNYFTFTKYKGMDPEAGSTDDAFQGIDRGVYPSAGIFMLGLSLSL